MPKDSSVKYYKKNKERQKHLMKGIKKKKMSSNMSINDINIFLSMKKKC